MQPHGPFTQDIQKIMAIRAYIPLSSTTLQRILLWGVPSLTLLGLVGAAGVRLWFYRKMKNTNSPAIPAASPKQVSSNTSQDRPSGRTDSEQERYSHEERLNSRKNSQETCQDRFASSFKIPSKLSGKQLTSSNLQPPPLESETPLKPSGVATTGNHVSLPAINRESFSDESTSSSEGLLSLPCKSPAGVTPPAGSAQTEPSAVTTSSSNHVALSNHVASSGSVTSLMNQVQAGMEETTSSKDSSSPPQTSRKDRIRITVQIPRSAVGRFIGKQGRNIKSLMTGSNGAHVYVNQKNLPKDAEFVLCTIQGTAGQIKDAIQIIAAKYPEIMIPPFPQLLGEGGILHNISPVPSPHFGTLRQNGESWEVELLLASIPQGSFSAMVCYLETLTELWLVTCERSVELEEQHQSMSFTYCYTTANGSDHNTVKDGDRSLLGKFCAVKVSEIHWLRGRVTRFGDDAGSYEVQLMDYGSIVVVPPSSIKPLRWVEENPIM